MAGECETPIGDGSALLCWFCAHAVTHHGMELGGCGANVECTHTREEIYPAEELARRERATTCEETAPRKTRPSIRTSYMHNLQRADRRERITRLQLHRTGKDSAEN